MTVIKVAESLGRMFYIVSPKASTFGTEQEVPPYVADATPWFVFFIVAELLYYTFKNKGKGLRRHDGNWEQGKYRLNDMIGSLGSGSIQQMSRFFLGSLQMVTYKYIWDNYRIESIAFDTFKLSTWIGCFIGVGKITNDMISVNGARSNSGECDMPGCNLLIPNTYHSIQLLLTGSATGNHRLCLLLGMSFVSIVCVLCATITMQVNSSH